MNTPLPHGRGSVASLIPVLLCWSVYAADAQPSFEVASVKALDPKAARGASAVQFLPGGRFVAQSVSLHRLIELVYDVRDFQISGGPG